VTQMWDNRPVSNPAKRLATYEDILGLPENVRAEVIAGEVLVQPSPTPGHQYMLSELYAQLTNPFQRGRGGPGGWWFIQDVDVAFGRHDIYRTSRVGAKSPCHNSQRRVPCQNVLTGCAKASRHVPHRAIKGTSARPISASVSPGVGWQIHRIGPSPSCA
jgi:hypothetical protein